MAPLVSDVRYYLLFAKKGSPGPTIFVKFGFALKKFYNQFCQSHYSHWQGSEKSRRKQHFVHIFNMTWAKHRLKGTSFSNRINSVGCPLWLMISQLRASLWLWRHRTSSKFQYSYYQALEFLIWREELLLGSTHFCQLLRPRLWLLPGITRSSTVSPLREVLIVFDWADSFFSSWLSDSGASNVFVIDNWYRLIFSRVRPVTWPK